MNDVILQFLYGLACIVVGFFVGLSLSWREYKLRGRHLAAPSLPRTDRQQAYWLMVVAALAVASAAYAGVQATTQAECNAEFKQSLVARSAITLENQRHLDSMIGTVADAMSNPRPDSREVVRRAIGDYRSWAIETEKKRAANPIADPVCGD